MHKYLRPRFHPHPFGKPHVIPVRMRNHNCLHILYSPSHAHQPLYKRLIVPRKSRIHQRHPSPLVQHKPVKHPGGEVIGTICDLHTSSFLGRFLITSTHLLVTMEPILRKAKIPNPWLADCPCREVLGLLGNKWTMLILPLLHKGACRNAELLRGADGISQKILTQTLRDLE